MNKPFKPNEEMKAKAKLFFSREEVNQVLWTSVFIGCCLGFVIGLLVGWLVFSGLGRQI